MLCERCKREIARESKYHIWINVDKNRSEKLCKNTGMKLSKSINFIIDQLLNKDEIPISTSIAIIPQDFKRAHLRLELIKYQELKNKIEERTGRLTNEFFVNYLLFLSVEK